MQQAQSTDGADAAAQLVGKSLDLQLPEIDRFRATDPSEFADISLDPDRVVGAHDPGGSSNRPPSQNTTYERRGALHFQNDPVRSAKLFSDTGTDLVAMGKTNVYETKDADRQRRSSTASAPNSSRPRSRRTPWGTCPTAVAFN